MRHQFDKDYPYKDRAELISAAVSNVEGSMFFVDSGDGTGLPHLNRLVFQSKFLRGHRCTIPAWSLLPPIEHFFTEVSRLRIERALPPQGAGDLRSIPAADAAFVFAKRDVQRPVQRVLNSPMAAKMLCQPRHRYRQAADREHHLV